jgi:transposase InsO family protein
VGAPVPRGRPGRYGRPVVAAAPSAEPDPAAGGPQGSAYRSHQWGEVCGELGITPKKTRPYRPQANGKIERFHRTRADGWAFAKFYSSQKARRAALPAFLHDYNHHRHHTAIAASYPSPG